jgi:class 3 adenylate cyclase
VAREQRMLAAILFADVVGSSRLMGRDEIGTVARLLEHLNRRLAPAAARCGGRVIRADGRRRPR